MNNLLYRLGKEKVTVDMIRWSNSQGRQLCDLVAVFVGGTGGIGESTAKEFFLRTTRPKAYIIGRNESNGQRICSTLREMNPEGTAIYIKKDIHLLSSIDELCAELMRLEPKIHCLFLTAGYMTLRGRTETVEGLDRKMAVNYYSRMRCITQLLPPIRAAAEAHELSRVISVLAAGSEGDVRMDDLELKHNFTLFACLAHCVVMTDFAIEELARREPNIAFSHSYPGTVKTGIANELPGPARLAVKVLYAVMTPWILNVQESGERHYFQMTSKCYPARNGGVGIEKPEGLSVMQGSDGEDESGAYLLDWDGKPAGDEAVLKKYRDLGMNKVVWDHLTFIFERAERLTREAKATGKRKAEEEAEGSGRFAPYIPAGWRAG